MNTNITVELRKYKKSHATHLCGLDLSTKVWQKNPYYEKTKETVNTFHSAIEAQKKEYGHKFYTIIIPGSFLDKGKPHEAIVGFVEFKPDKPFINRRAYIDYYIDKQWRNIGVGKSMMVRIINTARNDLKLHKLLAAPHSINTASNKLLEKTNWSFVGTYKNHERHNCEEKWDDICIYEYLLE